MRDAARALCPEKRPGEEPGPVDYSSPEAGKALEALFTERFGGEALKTLKAELLASAETRAAYDAQADEFAVARELIAARTKAGLTQADVAERMGTTQSTVARLEGGKAAPSLRSLQRYAQAVGCRAVVHLEHA